MGCEQITQIDTDIIAIGIDIAIAIDGWVDTG